MLLAVLLHLLIFHLLTASDAPPRAVRVKQNKTKLTKDTDYTITHIDTCPDVGFFFQTTANSLTPDVCFLCFCQGDHKAVCWKRENRRCNTESFHYHVLGKRHKRSPGFSDIFFRDASRDIFNRNTKPQCKPYESSFSDDCPPVDWCTGCTVCDCDANGRWDCHLLSFCSEDKKKSPKPKGSSKIPDSWKQYVAKKQEKLINKNSTSISATTKRPNSIKSYKIPKKVDKKKAKHQIQRGGKKKPQPPRRIVQKRVPLKPGATPDPGKMKTPIKYKKVTPNKKLSSKEMIIKRDIATRKPIAINKSIKVNIEMDLAHKLMKKVMQSLKKQVTASFKNMSEIVKRNAKNVRNMKAKAKLRQAKNKPKSMSKRQIKKPTMPPYKKKRVPMKKPIYRAREKPPRKTSGKTFSVRHKRDVTMPGNIGVPANVSHENFVESSNITAALTVILVTTVPDSSIPVTSVPDIRIPVTSVPDTSIPVASTSVTSIPETSKPVTSIPLASTPLTSIPETSKPVTSIPLASTSVTSIPLASTLVTSIPVTSKPVTSIPLASTPVTSIPETSKPVTSIPLASTPETSISDTSKPVTSIPLPSTPVTSKLESSKPVTSKPDIIIPKTSISVTSIPVITIPVISIPVTSNPTVVNDGNFSHALIGSSTVPDKKYYKYTIGSEEPRTNLNISIGDTVTKQFNKTETVFNLLGAQLSSNLRENNYVENNEIYKRNNSKELSPEENKLKFSKWINLKILREKKVTSESDINIKDKRPVKFWLHANKTVRLDEKNRSHGKKVERKVNHHKKNIVKILNRSKCKFNNCKMNNTINIHMSDVNNGDTYGYIPKIVNIHHKNSTTYSPKRKRKTGVLKYLKSIFNKIFKGSRTSEKMNKYQLINTLCENFGPCFKVNRRDSVLLNSKLSDLDRETTRILKTVKIIKGLLKLLVLPENVHGKFSKQDHIRNDIQKLNNILKGIYSENAHVKLTATQLTQIEYIKKSTQDFIKSVSKFASLLNQIIAILTKQNTNHIKNKANHHFMNKNLSKHDPFQSLKDLLLRYNLVQNTFMKKIYEQLHNFEHKIVETPKVSERKDLNNTITIENISRNMIHNLRKLKHLAQTGSYSRRERVRSKRDIGRDDDAIEYMLLLMEYLIKQNHPLDAEPVNDGIDLLIEAIKNAPDIKPIKKKVLEYTTAIYPDVVTTTTSPTTSSTATSEDTKSEDDSPSESDKTSSSEDSSKTKLEGNESKLKQNKNFVELVADDEKEFEDKLQFDRRAEPQKMDEITELAFFSKFGAEDNIMLEPNNIFETTTATNSIMPLDMETGDKLDSRDDLNLEKTLGIESNNLDKPIEYSESGDKKIEVFTGDMDEETILQSTVIPEPDIPTTTSTEVPTKAYQSLATAKIKHKNRKSHDIDRDDKISRLKWIEENFGKESEKRFRDSEEKNSTLGITPVTAKTITVKTDVSDLNRQKGEVRGRYDEKDKDNTGKKTKEKLSAEEIMFRKQMELLNSLDYGTERAEVFESDSKDSNVEERYTGDNFPSYFV